jgi:hypothetical protein
MLGKPGTKYPKAPVKWYVSAQSGNRAVEGVTREVSTRQAYIHCSKPFRLNEVLDVTITAPDRSLKVSAEVVWSNMYGYDDEITPRGMGVRFLNISYEDRRFLARMVESEKSLKLEEKASEYLKTLKEELGEN